MARIETDALNGLVAALQTFVPPLVGDVLDPTPFLAALVRCGALADCGSDHQGHYYQAPPR